MKLPVDIGSTSDIPEALPTGPTSPNADRDTALDHDPAVVVPPPLPAGGPTESELQAEADVDAAIAEGRAVVSETVTTDSPEGAVPLLGCARHGCGKPCPACALESQ